MKDKELIARLGVLDCGETFIISWVMIMFTLLTVYIAVELQSIILFALGITILIIAMCMIFFSSKREFKLKKIIKEVTQNGRNNFRDSN